MSSIPVIPANTITSKQVGTRRAYGSGELRAELIRKSIHFSIALVPTLVGFVGVAISASMLLFGILAFVAAEFARSRGVRIVLISRITELASRDRDAGRFVLGPVTLGFGALIALMLYPEPAASLAIYALAFGDGIASLAGKLFGRTRIPRTGGKSFEGSFACFLAVTIVAAQFFPNPALALVIGLFAAVVEALPFGDFDNIALPTSVGAFVILLV